ncbi:hypothetical protein REC12_06415 [Desulfosporosinus sp. PR]|uniref:hypothetical protein n=1 Tax=Candidatus Desulfosporosinus nitrosoreducens TaxID=3401928 RepID=UPI0027F53295|nr:hypothetical protein [Desulfosporosinus sp. PR]MDQ7093217.1 hypothetical protein [Desulfosporosinus sp. PR]
MSKYVVCQNTRKHDELVQALNQQKIEFETIDCMKKCLKCRTRVMIMQDDTCLSASTVEKLLAKLSGPHR